LRSCKFPSPRSLSLVLTPGRHKNSTCRSLPRADDAGDRASDRPVFAARGAPPQAYGSLMKVEALDELLTLASSFADMDHRREYFDAHGLDYDKTVEHIATVKRLNAIWMRSSPFGELRTLLWNTVVQGRAILTAIGRFAMVLLVFFMMGVSTDDMARHRSHDSGRMRNGGISRDSS